MLQVVFQPDRNSHTCTPPPVDLQDHFDISMALPDDTRILPRIRLATLERQVMTRAKQLAFTGLLTAALALTSSSPAWSHHSHAMFDHDKEVTITGTVSQWIFRNPHVFLYVDGKAESGETVTYTVEMSNITNMLKVGFTATTFKAGDKVTVTMHPLIDGRPGGNYIVATSGDGKQFGRI